MKRKLIAVLGAIALRPVVSFTAFTALLILTNVTTLALADEKVLPSQLPPAGLSAKVVPQFVTLGFDDNSEAPGVEWTLNTLAKFTNDGGLGNPATFDGEPIKSSFFPRCGQAVNNPAIADAWRQIFLQGHEVGNHTFDHRWGQTFEQSEWETQMQLCMDKLSAPWHQNDANSGAGIPLDEIVGFRAPALIYNDNTFKAMKNMGLTYDVSIQEGLQTNQQAGNYYWPYTLDEGSPGSKQAYWQPNIGKHPGIWSLPVHVLQIIPDDQTHHYGLNYSLLDKMQETLKKFNWKGNKVTAFDYNLYATGDWLFALNKDDVLALFKYNLDQRLEGNRAPLVLGFHTEYLSGQVLPNMTATSPQERREVLEEFLEYANSKKAVRIVRHIDVINWMANPVKLVVCADEHWDFRDVYVIGDTVTYQGHLWTAKWWNKLETPLAKEWSAWQDEGKCVD